MKRRTLFITIAALFILGGLYIFPKMINQGEYKKYLLYVPDQLPETGKYPLLLYLHGRATRNNDVNTLEDSGPRPFLMKNSEYPFVVVSPLCADNDSWHPHYLLRLIDTIEAKLPIDKNKIYVTCLSMGGNGTWNLAR